MREETRQALDRLVFKDRRQLRWSLVEAVLAAVPYGFVASPLSIRSQSRVQGTVTFATLRPNARDGTYHVTIDAVLDDRRLVRAAGLPASPPKLDPRVSLVEVRRWLWFADYYRSGDTN